MRVTNITVSYLREYQPEKFQKSVPAIEMSAVVDDGEDYAGVARTLMSEIVHLAYNTLGYETPAKILDKLMGGGTVDQGQASSVVTTTTVPEARSEPLNRSEPPAETPAPAKRKRRTKAEIAADKAAVEAAVIAENKSSAASAEVTKAEQGSNVSEIPGEEKPQIQTNPEDRVNPDDEIPGAEPEAKTTVADLEGPVSNGEDVGQINAADIKAYAASLCNDKTNNFVAQHYREILQSAFGQSRTEDIPVDQLGHLKELMDKAAAA
jgi:hypothetical protein